MAGYAGGTAGADLIRVRRMVNETRSGTYTDPVLATLIAAYPVLDVAGEKPRLSSGSVNTDWTATYDLASAASDIWTEKAANIAGEFDFNADGMDAKRSQAVEQYLKQAAMWRSRRTARSIAPWVDLGSGRAGQEWIGNLAEVD